MRIDDLPLLPTPRSRESLAGTTDLSLPPRIELVLGGFDKPAEHEIIATDTLLIRARDQAGITAAKQTLQQISKACPHQLQAFRIHDWAAFTHRGFMLDVSRDRIPTMPELRNLISLLASLKYNHLQMYIEHTFAYAGHETVWRDHDPITPAQIQQLDLWCMDAGIELAANQNCFGHLTAWLKHPDYAHLAETQGEFDFFEMTRTGPFSLCPINPGSEVLVRDWIHQLRACHMGNRINIGCDETADVGTGQSAQAVVTHGYARVYADYVNRVARVCQEEGFSPMFWADTAVSHPDSIALLDNSLTALVWGYEPESVFSDSLLLFHANGFVSWVCPGTSCWRSFTGRTTERKVNISSAASAGVEHGCDGFLLTAWGDLGHRQQWPITLRAIADGAQAAWAGSGSASTDACDMFAFDAPGSGISAWLDTLGDTDRILRNADTSKQLPKLINASAIFHELHPAHDSMPTRGSLEQWNTIRASLDEQAHGMPTTTNAQLSRELAHAHRCAAFAADVAIMRRGGAIAHGLDDLIAEHESLWLLRSREAGLVASSSYYRNLNISGGDQSR